MRSIAELWRNDKGQATTEYILVLAIVAGIFLLVLRGLLQPFFARLSGRLVENFEQRLFGGDLHRYNIGQ